MTNRWKQIAEEMDPPEKGKKIPLKKVLEETWKDRKKAGNDWFSDWINADWDRDDDTSLPNK